MADYHAVLQRTLSGLNDPKPQLREKLYDRARAMTRRQLEGRSPAVSGAALEAELTKLELAIAQIENRYSSNQPVDDSAQSEPETVHNNAVEQPAAELAQAETAEAGSWAPPEYVTEEVVDRSPEPAASPETADEHDPYVADAPEPAHQYAPESPDETFEQNEPQPDPNAWEMPEGVDPYTAHDTESAGHDSREEAAHTGQAYDERSYSSDSVAEIEENWQPAPRSGYPRYGVDQPVEVAYPQEPTEQVDQWLATKPEPAAVDPMLEAMEKALQVHPSAGQTAATQRSNIQEVDPIDQWADEFMATQPSAPAQPTANPGYSASSVSSGLPSAPQLDDPYFDNATSGAMPEARQPVSIPAFDQASDPAQKTAGTLPQFSSSFGDAAQENLSIPPAGGFGERTSRRPKKRGLLKWIVLILLIALLFVGGYFGWMHREVVAERLNLSALMASILAADDEAVRPTPVKTITIKPDPEPVAQPETSQAPAPTSTEPVAKVEKRLTEDGEEISAPTSSPAPVSPELNPAAAIPKPEGSNAPPPIAQNAILYEEGSVPAENSVDAGRVVWSVVEEAPSADEPKEPAIRARIEIPSRSVVLIMTIKRNTDKALPASHLIELIFAVPDDFSGGGIGQINRYVLKENEQGRGEALVAVPARIADGIFLIALNNLPEAKTQNETLLKSRDWIDIPMEYRTGRRALVTIEKGIPGAQVFKEVFEAWDAKQ